MCFTGYGRQKHADESSLAANYNKNNEKLGYIQDVQVNTSVFTYPMEHFLSWDILQCDECYSEHLGPPSTELFVRP